MDVRDDARQHPSGRGGCHVHRLQRYEEGSAALLDYYRCRNRPKIQFRTTVIFLAENVGMFHRRRIYFLQEDSHQRLCVNIRFDSSNKAGALLDLW